MARERVGNMATDPAATPNDARARLINREIVQLLQLSVLAVAAFFVTRALAESNRDTTRRNGAEWYERGAQLLAGGEAERAVTAFRRAVVTNRQEPKYVLALAGALARQHQNDAARASLLALRESAPEHPEVNLQLARLAAARTDIAEAVRYCHSTLYGPWPREDEERRRQVRLELIDFLLRNGQTESGISELVALSTDVPDRAAAYVGLAARFVKAGDRRDALLQFQRALRLEPRNQAILAAAGQNAFELGDYQLARRNLRSIVGGDPAVEEIRARWI
jgi:Flp pilus assembly protein TadD